MSPVNESWAQTERRFRFDVSQDKELWLRLRQRVIVSSTAIGLRFLPRRRVLVSTTTKSFVTSAKTKRFAPHRHTKLLASATTKSFYFRYVTGFGPPPRQSGSASVTTRSFGSTSTQSFGFCHNKELYDHGHITCKHKVRIMILLMFRLCGGRKLRAHGGQLVVLACQHTL